MLSVVALLLAAGVVSASVVQHRPERRVADANFLKQQTQIFEIYTGVAHNQVWTEEFENYDISANFASFTDEKYPKQFLHAYKRGFMPKDGVFTVFCSHTREDYVRLFDLFYFAKDFDTFIKVAYWAKSHIHPVFFTLAFTQAVIHRSDTQSFKIPPFYEILPNYFTPVDTLHHAFDARMEGVKEGRYTYNNTGYEYNYHKSMFGGLFSEDNRGYGDFRVSYFREDVGLNNFMVLMALRNIPWMSAEKYNTPWLKRRGENLYQIHQQLLARYTQERFSHGLPYAEVLKWDRPIKVGYNPRIAHVNGQNLYMRPDNMVPSIYNYRGTAKTEHIERRVWDAIDFGSIWATANKSLLSLRNEDGVDVLGELFFGTVDSPSRYFYKSAYHKALQALAFVSSTGSDHSFVGNAMSTPFTFARDPAFYNYLARMVKMFQHFKKTLHPYTHDEVSFDGVKVQNVEVDKFLTYFDLFDYEVTNAVPFHERNEYKEHRYTARQYRLNHKPYSYNVTVESDKAADAVVRVFLGQRHGPDEHKLTVEQARLTFVEIDRFQAKLNTGVNVFERNSKESPIFVEEKEGFRAMYNHVRNQQTPVYVSEYGHCGFPERLQLPMGWRGGRPAQLAVVVNPFDRSHAHKEGSAAYDVACGGGAMYDGRPFGFPFDRPLHHGDFHVPNVYFKDVQIYHRDQTEVNRPAAS